jgi:hypothetical protein
MPTLGPGLHLGRPLPDFTAGRERTLAGQRGGIRDPIGGEPTADRPSRSAWRRRPRWAPA